MSMGKAFGPSLFIVVGGESLRANQQLSWAGITNKGEYLHGSVIENVRQRLPS